MKGNDGKKFKSLALVMVMLMAALTVMIIVNVETTKAVPIAFDMTGPTDSKVYSRGKAVYASWGASTNADWYDVTIKRFGTGEPAAGTAVTTVNTTNLYYSWSTFGREIGQYKIDVIAVQHLAANGTQYKLEATGNNKTVYIIRGTPGHTAFQGGNETIASNGDEIISSTECSIWPLEYHPTNTVDIVVNSSQSWSASYKYFLWKPQYNGTSDGGTYEFGWWGGRVASSYETIAQVDPDVADYTFDDVVLDRSGLWVIDIREDNPGNPNYDVTDADFSTYALSNSTVAGWFWVNASDGITLALGDDDDEFLYNSTGAITLTVTNSVVADEDSAIVDVRYDKNESSIYEYNIPTGDGGILDTGDSRYYLKNNSFSKQASSYRKYGFWNVGNYTAYACIDMDTWSGGYYNKYRQNNMANSSSGSQHWNSTYGANAALSGADTTVFPSTRYNWTIAGPWDSPEYEAATKSIVVNTREPYTLENNGTQNYGFEGEVNITIRESLGGSKFLDEYKINVQVFNPDDESVNEHVVITNYTHITQGWICIYSATWGKDGASIGGNGTWYAYIYIDENNDRGLDTLTEYTEEWNATVEWTVGRAGAITFDWVDDDGQVYGVDNWGFKNKPKDQIIPYIPDRHNVPLDVEFMLRGDDGSYFGDILTANTQQSGNCKTIKECAENITISGNSLITGTLDKFPGYVDLWTVDNQTGYASNIWHVPIIPTMSAGGGTITLSYIAYNSSGSSTLSVGGDNPERNGSIVSALNQDGTSTFDIDIVNQTLTTTAKNADDDPIPFHWARLYYMNDRGAVNNSLIEQAYLGGSGSGTMNFNTTMQTTNQSLIDFNANGAPDGTTEIRAPRNLTIWVDGPNRMDGYALLKMERASDLEVELFPSTFLAGYKYNRFHVNCTIAGNSTAAPNESNADQQLFYIMIKDSAGNDVTTTILRCIDAINDLQAGSGHTTSAKPYSFTFKTNVFGIAPDTYTFYCYNNTHDSQGYNGTLTIGQVDVAHSFADGSTEPLIWQSDDNVSITFTVTYNGEAIDGTLRVDNMTHKAANGYNRSWSLTNFTSTLTTTGSDQENTSITITDDMMDNGVFTMHDITPAHLDTGRFVRNISYWFEPASPNDGSYARAIGRLPVRVPAVTPDPAYIPLEGTTTVTLLTTGRGSTPLPNIFVGLDGRGISIATTNGTTGSDGKLALSVNPNSAGNMDIHVGEDGRIVQTKVVVTNWKIVIDSPVKVNEGSDFIVTLTELASGEVVEDASVTLSGVGTVTTDADGIASFSGEYVAPEVSSDIAYTLTAAKEGYVGATTTITIINVPKLTLTVKYPNEKGKGSNVGICVEQTFTVTVSKDDASPAVNALVTLQGDTTQYYTDGNGAVTITAPSSSGAYTVTASFGSFLAGTVTVTVLSKDNQDWCSTPGFELLTLLAAIGVAFILLRRRRH